MLARIAPHAEAFANAVLAEKRGICGIRFEKCLVIFCHDDVEGSKDLRTSFAQVMQAHERTAVQEGEMKL